MSALTTSLNPISATHARLEQSAPRMRTCGETSNRLLKRRKKQKAVCIKLDDAFLIAKGGEMKGERQI